MPLLRFGRMLALAVAVIGISACEQSEPPVAGGAPGLKRLTESQYRNIVADVFGSHIVVAGVFDPLARDGGLIALGAAKASVTASGFERFDNLARAIAAQVTSPANRSTLIGCGPADGASFDRACAETFLTETGRYLYRRPLDADEVEMKVKTAAEAFRTTGDFYAALSQAIAGLLVSPNFLYVAEAVEPDPDRNGVHRLTGYAKASRLSFLLWDTAPDKGLLDAAAAGTLHTEKGLAAEVDRMLASPRLIQGVRSFFADMLALDKFATLEKDPEIYANFNPEAGEMAREQLLRTVVSHLLVDHGDYRDLFTSRTTFMHPAIGRLYRVAVPDPDGWARYQFSQEHPYAGLQTLVSFAALHAHPGRSSPTLRGKAVRELLMCQRIPDPPGDVDFTQFNDPKSPIATARQRLTAHATAPSCVGCHKLTDPVGLALENLDGVGQFRKIENNATIDPSGELDGVPFADAAGLGKALRDNPAVPSCLVSRVVAYGVGRERGALDSAWFDYLNTKFAEGGYRLPVLLRTLVTSRGFFAVDNQDKSEGGS